MFSSALQVKGLISNSHADCFDQPASERRDDGRAQALHDGVSERQGHTAHGRCCAVLEPALQHSGRVADPPANPALISRGGGIALQRELVARL